MQVSFIVGAQPLETAYSDSKGEKKICPDQRRRNEADFAIITANSFPSWMQAWSDSQTSLWASGFALCHCLNGDFVLKIRQDLWHSGPYLSDDAQQSRFV